MSIVVKFQKFDSIYYLNHDNKQVYCGEITFTCESNKPYPFEKFKQNGEEECEKTDKKENSSDILKRFGEKPYVMYNGWIGHLVERKIYAIVEFSDGARLLLSGDQFLEILRIDKKKQRWINLNDLPVELEGVVELKLDFEQPFLTNLTLASLLVTKQGQDEQEVNHHPEDCALMCQEISKALSTRIQRRSMTTTTTTDNCNDRDDDDANHFKGTKLSDLFLKVPLFLQETDRHNAKWLTGMKKENFLYLHVSIECVAALELSIQWLSPSSPSSSSSSSYSLLGSKKPPPIIVGAECANVKFINPYSGLTMKDTQNYYYYQLTGSDQLYDTSSTSHRSLLYHALTGNRQELEPFHRPLLPSNDDNGLSSSIDDKNEKMEVEPTSGEQVDIANNLDADWSESRQVDWLDACGGETKSIGQKPTTEQGSTTHKSRSADDDRDDGPCKMTTTTTTLKVGDWVVLGLIDCRPQFTVQWMDGTIDHQIDQSRLLAVDDNEGDHQFVNECALCPGYLVSHIDAFVMPSTSISSGVASNTADNLDDVSVLDYGTIISVNSRDRICVVQWFNHPTYPSSSLGFHLTPAGPPRQFSLYELTFSEFNQLKPGYFMLVDTCSAAAADSKTSTTTSSSHYRIAAGFVELAVPELDSFMRESFEPQLNEDDPFIELSDDEAEDLSDDFSSRHHHGTLEARWEEMYSELTSRLTREQFDLTVPAMRTFDIVQMNCSLANQHLLPALFNLASLHFTTSLNPSPTSTCIIPDSCQVLFGIVAANTKAEASQTSIDHPCVMSMPLQRPLFPLSISPAYDVDRIFRVVQMIRSCLSGFRSLLNEARYKVLDERLSKMIRRCSRQKHSLYATTLKDLIQTVPNLCPYLIKITPRGGGGGGGLLPLPTSSGDAKNYWTLSKLPVTRKLLEDPRLRVAIVGSNDSTSESQLNDLDPDWMTRVHYLSGRDFNAQYNLLLVSELILEPFTSVMQDRASALRRPLKAVLEALPDTWLRFAGDIVAQVKENQDTNAENKAGDGEDSAAAAAPSTVDPKPDASAVAESKDLNKPNVVVPDPRSISAIPMQERGKFSIEDQAPQCHYYYASTKLKCPAGKEFFKSWRRDTSLLAKTAPKDIIVKAYADRLDLFSIMIIGSADTPYEHGLFMFDLQLPEDYPHSPPKAHYHSLAAERINPNLYVCGRICLSLLGTWSGLNTENWLPESSNLLQLVVSLKGLILNSEPYFNEPGYETYRNHPDSHDASRVYNESVVATLARTMVRLCQSPYATFKDEIESHFRTRGEAYASLLAYWATLDTETYGKLQQKPSSFNHQEDQQPSASSTGNFLAPTTKHCLPEFPLAPVSKGFQLSIQRPVSFLRQFAASQNQL